MVSPINRKTLVHEVKFIPTVHTSKLHFSPVATFFTSMRVTEIDVEILLEIHTKYRHHPIIHDTMTVCAHAELLKFPKLTLFSVYHSPDVSTLGFHPWTIYPHFFADVIPTTAALSTPRRAYLQIKLKCLYYNTLTRWQTTTNKLRP